MNEFRIYGEIGNNPDTVSFRKFMEEVEDKINANEEIIERSKQVNKRFAEKIVEYLEKPHTEFYIGRQVAEFQRTLPRYSAIKNLEYNGEAYEAEIDELERKFWLHKV